MSTVESEVKTRGRIVLGDQEVCIPGWVRDHASYRRWTRSSVFPERGGFSYLKGELWVDLSMERLAHNKVKSEISIVLGALVRSEDLGHFFFDNMLLTHLGAELSTEPDAMFVSNAALEEGRVLFEEGAECLEVEGSPDMILEVVSSTSVQKDTVVLRELYYEAGVLEYWLVDPRDEKLSLEILHPSAKGYVSTRKKNGWRRSHVFGKSFLLTQETDKHGLPKYTLTIR